MAADDLLEIRVLRRNQGLFHGNNLLVASATISGVNLFASFRGTGGTVGRNLIRAPQQCGSSKYWLIRVLRKQELVSVGHWSDKYFSTVILPEMLLTL